MEIEILEQQCGGTEFVPRPHRLHLGAQNAEGVARRLKRSKSSLSVLSSKTAPSQTPYFSNSPLYKRKAKSSSVKTLHFLLSRDSTRSIRIYSPFS
mgnify:CR=1 FL=1